MCWMFVAGKGMTLCYLIYKGPFFYFKFWILISGNGVTLYYTDPQTERTPGVDDRLVMLMMKKINYKQLGKVISAFRWYNGADMGHRKKRPEMTNFFTLFNHFLDPIWPIFVLKKKLHYLQTEACLKNDDDGENDHRLTTFVSAKSSGWSSQAGGSYPPSRKQFLRSLSDEDIK